MDGARLGTDLFFLLFIMHVFKQSILSCLYTTFYKQ